ncbi:bifunctional 2-polyprenyl-6-hydroxyphenol methylase/3-demethylubiquinol 3-O-methyltransferase UbiG [Polynucleobacter sp. AP-Ainpum-60-G11]|uniref:class I SAM-dependent methyltransferase n=1 Tax=Polynucleobacter sp. AP-Ainpum-60-G11 TaxID=2576926 RepID=UPI001BFDEA0D|nr:class I SAM-dependent methyltransferase [Polynucleobacter sp. AP-Ainpum-60-G11]QWE27143.1 class I SAM-dependent methyltransferase [Polynucleobacter sp. AP-Ainpum-60-G11]
MSIDDLSPSVESLASFWENAGLDYIIPNTGSEFPEGFDLLGVLRQLIPSEMSVVEIGCGYGRLCSTFAPDKYQGFDINPKAIAHGKSRFPNYNLNLIKPWESLPKSDLTLAYCTAFHIPDNELGRFLKLLSSSSDAVLIAELMDRRWRREGNPPIFNREPEEYVTGMLAENFFLTNILKLPYQRYDCEPWNINRDIRLTFHLYKRFK